MKLCSVLGYPSTRVMFRHMTMKDFLEWWAYDQVEPLGGTRDDYLAASICCSIMNGIAVLARSRKRFKIKDFVLEWGKESSAVDQSGKSLPSGQPWQQMKMAAKMWAAIANADEAAKGAKTARRRVPAKQQRQAEKNARIQAMRDLLKTRGAKK